jgi:hypothetical protein
LARQDPDRESFLVIFRLDLLVSKNAAISGLLYTSSDRQSVFGARLDLLFTSKPPLDVLPRAFFKNLEPPRGGYAAPVQARSAARQRIRNSAAAITSRTIPYQYE